MNSDLVKIKCKYAKKCPGCPQIQFVYAKQISNKQKMLEDLLGGLAKRSGIKIGLVIRSPLQGGYRTTSKLALHQDNFARKSIGIYERGSKDVVDIADCPVHAPEINQIVAKIFRSTPLLPFEFYNHTKKAFQENCLKFVTVRVGSKSQHAGVIISHTGVSEADLRGWVEKRFPKNLSVWSCKLTPADRDLILSANVTHLAGPRELNFQIGQLNFDLHPASFFQANTSLSEAFLGHICEGQKGRVLLDLYGGFGAYSLAVAKNFEQVFLVDGNDDAVASAGANAKQQSVTNLTAKSQFCEAFLKGMNENQKKSVSHVIVNPPRAGLTEAVRKYLNKKYFVNLKQLTYVSCNPQTLRRDLEDLSRSGKVAITSIQPFDMFPQTNHIETVVRLAFS